MRLALEAIRQMKFSVERRRLVSGGERMKKLHWPAEDERILCLQQA